MAYDEHLADRIRLALCDVPNTIEKRMMGSLVFMVNDKMCVGVFQDELMCRVSHELHETLVEQDFCRTMDFIKKPMIGYVLVSQDGLKTNKELKHFIGLSLAFNVHAKASKKTKPKSK